MLIVLHVVKNLKNCVKFSKFSFYINRQYPMYTIYIYILKLQSVTLFLKKKEPVNSLIFKTTCFTPLPTLLTQYSACFTPNKFHILKIYHA